MRVCVCAYIYIYITTIQIDYDYYICVRDLLRSYFYFCHIFRRIGSLLRKPSNDSLIKKDVEDQYKSQHLS